MRVPDAIQDKARAGLELMLAHPAHHFDWKIRRDIYQLFAPYSDPPIFRARCHLAISAAEYVLPIFTSHFPDQDLPSRLIATAVGIVVGQIDRNDPHVSEVEDEGYHANGGYMAYDATTQMVLYNASYAAFAAYKALAEIRHMQNPWQHVDRLSKSNNLYAAAGRVNPSLSTPGSQFTDEDWASLAAAGDTAAAAAMAFSTSERDPAPKADRLKEFWGWWVNVALPGAWQAVDA